jgi:polygalacturonase
MKAVNEEKAPPFDMPPVEPPSFPDRVFAVQDCGAVSDGETANTDAIRQAVEGHGGVVIGSGMSGGVRNVYAHDCSFEGGERGIRLKSMRGRGGFVENVTFENIRMTDLRRQAIVINMFYGSSTAAPRSKTPPVFRNIAIRNVTCERVALAVDVRGLPEQPVSDVVLEHLRIHAVQGVRCQDVDGLTLNDVSGSVEKRPALSYENVQRLNETEVNLE